MEKQIVHNQFDLKRQRFHFSLEINDLVLKKTENNFNKLEPKFLLHNQKVSEEYISKKELNKPLMINK